MCKASPFEVSSKRQSESCMTDDKRKQSLYFPEEMLIELQAEAVRLDRSLSWIVQRCVKIGLAEVKKLPGMDSP